MAPRIVFAAPPTNPLLQMLYLIVGVILLGVALFFGAILLAIVFGAALILAVVVWARVWWLRRKMAKAQGSSGSRGGSAAGSRGGVEITEVEYHVVRERDRDRDRESGDS